MHQCQLSSYLCDIDHIFSILIIVCVATTKERTMTGPLDRLFGNGPFDLNRNGKIDACEIING